MATSAPDLTPTIARYVNIAFQASDQSKQGVSLEAFTARLQVSGKALPIEVDTSHPLSHYFISSSHNTYLSGNQLWSKSSGDSYKDVLKRNCRCIEIDVWDGDSPSSSEAEDNGGKQEKDVGKLSGLLKKKLGRLRSSSNADKTAETNVNRGDVLMPTPWRTASGRAEPHVYHGYTATREVPFRKVCEVVRECAFRNTDLPLIVSLEVHCSPSQQEIMVELMTDYWGSLLERLPSDFTDTTPLPPLESLKRKILVKVKYTPPEQVKTGESGSNLMARKNSDPDTSSADEAADAVKKGKIIKSLSDMGIYTRAFHFKDFDQPEARIPTHVFSLGESKLLKACEEQPQKVLDHNLHYLMRAYPKGTRLRSSNLDPAPFWRFGLQMVALNFQKINAAMMLNDAQFDGTGGYVLKPKGYLPIDNIRTQPDRKVLGVKVKIFAASSLGPIDDIPNAFLKCELHVGSQMEADNKIPKGGQNKGGELKFTSSTRRSRDPDFDAETVEFNSEGIVPELSFLRFKVMDDTSYQKDRLLGWACYRLDRIPQGLILVDLKGEDSRPTSGKLLLDVHTSLTDKNASSSTSSGL